MRSPPQENRHTAVGIADRRPGCVHEIVIERSIAVPESHDVVPTRRGHVRAGHTHWYFDVVNHHLHDARDRARPKQYFHVREVPIIPGDYDPRLRTAPA